MKHIAFFGIFLLMVWTLSSCASKGKDDVVVDEVEQVDSVADVPSRYNRGGYDYPQPGPKVEITVSASPEPLQINLPVVGVSAAYTEGYDQGYEDGECDSYGHEGYQASYDDANGYRGRKSDDYEQGYEEGYEDGYEDGRDMDEYEDD